MISSTQLALRCSCAGDAGDEVIHTHFDRNHRPEYARIQGYPIRGDAGIRFLGEAIIQIGNSEELDCGEMRMIGSSPAFLQCVGLLSRSAQSEALVLLLGESGVGKELAAQYLHKRSLRRDKPFLAINCAAIGEVLFEDELFGHERGAFTGCIGRKQGLFELAEGGTLFLDEVGGNPAILAGEIVAGAGKRRIPPRRRDGNLAGECARRRRNQWRSVEDDGNRIFPPRFILSYFRHRSAFVQSARTAQRYSRAG